MITEQAIMKRAKEIFERDYPGDRRWGTVAGKSAVRVEIHEGTNPQPIAILSPPEREPYVERAQRELEDEARNATRP